MMSVVWLIAELPQLVLETVVICIFLLLLLLLLFVVFVPSTTGKMVELLSALRHLNNRKDKRHLER